MACIVLVISIGTCISFIFMLAPVLTPAPAAITAYRTNFSLFIKAAVSGRGVQYLHQIVLRGAIQSKMRLVVSTTTTTTTSTHKWLVAISLDY